MQQPAHDPSRPSADIESAEAFRGAERAFKDAQAQMKRDLEAEAAAYRHHLVEEMAVKKISDADWDNLMREAQKAAAHGEKQFLLLRFPSDLCSDDSRAINNPPNDTWPDTLRGEAADVYRRWNETLRPHGFNISAQVLDFPGGKPGDVGLFLRWGEAS